MVHYGPVHKIPDSISFEEAALAEPLACVLNAVELTNIRLWDTVVIIGAGPILFKHCWNLQNAKLARRMTLNGA